MDLSVVKRLFYERRKDKPLKGFDSSVEFASSIKLQIKKLTHMLVHRVRQLPVVVQYEPSSLPSLQHKSYLALTEKKLMRFIFYLNITNARTQENTMYNR